MAARTTKKSGAALERLRADLKAGSPANVYIFYGEETYLRDRYLEELRQLLAAEADRAAERGKRLANLLEKALTTENNLLKW